MIRGNFHFDYYTENIWQNSSNYLEATERKLYNQKTLENDCNYNRKLRSNINKN